MKFTLTEAKEALREIINDDPKIKFRVIYTIPGQADYRINSDSLSIPKFIAGNPAVYNCEIQREESGKTETLTSFIFEVPAKAKETETSLETRQFDKTDPMDILIHLREQDQKAWDREREGYKNQIDRLTESHKREIESLREKYDSDLKREKATYDFQLDILRNNHRTLDDEREKISARQYDLAKKEYALKKQNNDDFTFKDAIDLLNTFSGNGNTADTSHFRQE